MAVSYLKSSSGTKNTKYTRLWVLKNKKKIYLKIKKSQPLPENWLFVVCFLSVTRQSPTLSNDHVTESRTLDTEKHSAKNALPSVEHSTNEDDVQFIELFLSSVTLSKSFCRMFSRLQTLDKEVVSGSEGDYVISIGFSIVYHLGNTFSAPFCAKVDRRDP